MSDRPRYRLQNRESAGISSTHGGHQVAQKCTIVRCPFSWVRSIFLPPRSYTGSSGAAERKASEPDGDSGGTRERIQTAPTVTSTTAKAMVKIERVFILCTNRAIGSSVHRVICPDK